MNINHVSKEFIYSTAHDYDMTTEQVEIELEKSDNFDEFYERLEMYILTRRNS